MFFAAAVVAAMGLVAVVEQADVEEEDEEIELFLFLRLPPWDS